MNIELPTAMDLTSKRRAKEQAKRESIEREVEKFINGPLSTAILDATGSSVNVKTPALADMEEEFFTICNEVLERLGYDSGKSHDGGGMFTTLCVSWK